MIVCFAVLDSRMAYRSWVDPPLNRPTKTPDLTQQSTKEKAMKLFGWLLLVGGSLLSVANAFMLIMQAALWLTGHRSSWPPMGLSVLLGRKAQYWLGCR